MRKETNRYRNLFFNDYQYSNSFDREAENNTPITLQRLHCFRSSFSCFSCEVLWTISLHEFCVKYVIDVEDVCDKVMVTNMVVEYELGGRDVTVSLSR